MVSFLLLTSLLVQTAIQIKPIDVPQFEAVGIDESATYQALANDTTTVDLDFLRSFQVIFVPGILSNQRQILNRYLPVSTYFEEHAQWLRAQGVAATILPIESENTCAQNAEHLRVALEKSSRPVLLFTHSKGGVDALHMFHTYPETRLLVKGWVTINTPFYGSPLADWIIENRVSHYMAKHIFRLLGGTRESLRDLTSEVRRQFIQANQSQIETLLAEIPMISVGSHKKNVPLKIDTSLELPRNLMDSYGYQNDGAVPWQSAILPNVSFVKLENVDHSTIAHDSPWVDFDRIQMLNGLLKMLVLKIN
jgi:pimeloyl-ACP methyl ester carboxylesterase